jgi:hypothetical protein
MEKVERRVMMARIEYHSTSDRDGRCSFSLHWISSYHPGHPGGEHVTRERGQYFFGDPTERGYPRPESCVANKRNNKLKEKE